MKFENESAAIIRLIGGEKISTAWFIVQRDCVLA